jgi:TonB family protein
MATQPSRPAISESFGLLPESRGRFSSFTVSVAVNLALASLFLWIALVQLRKGPSLPRYESTSLVFPTTPPPQPPVSASRIKLPPPPPMKLVDAPPKIEMAKPLPEPPRPEIVHMNAPAMPVIPAAPPKAVVAPPQPKVGLFASAKATPAANNQVAPTAHVGGFGNPAGAAVNPTAQSTATPALGSFNAAPGASQGAGAAHRGVVQAAGFGSGVANGVPGGASRGTVASAGFTTGVVGGTGTARGGVAAAGFGTNSIGGNSAPAAKAEAVSFVAPEVISEPRPQYTEEARQLRIQGEVTLQVKFGADGKVEVLRVVSRLGHGLDEQAERVAQQIRFKPAARNGQPVDHITLIHIFFQLA